MDSLVFAVTDENGHLRSMREYDLLKTRENQSVDVNSAIKTIFEREQSFRFLHNKCRVAFQSDATCLIPNRLFNPARAADYLKQLISPGTTKSISNISLPNLQSELVFSGRSDLQKTLTSFHSNATFHPVSQSFLLGSQRVAKYRGGDCVFVNLESTRIEIAAYQSGNLMLHNHYQFSTTPDCLYYVLLVYSTLQFDPERIPLFVSGLLLQSGEIYKSFYRYIHHIEFTSDTCGVIVPDHFQNLQTYQYFTLFALRLV